MNKLVQKLEVGIEEVLLVALILIEALDFFTIIPAPVEYAEKVIAAIAMCYLFYKASITKITFGKREKNLDVLIIVSFLLLSFKTLIGFVITAAEEQTVMSGFYHVVLANVDVIEKTGFWIGGLVLLVVSGLLVHEKVSKPCIMRIIHEDKKAIGAGGKLVRFLTTYIVLLAIYVVLFTFAIEWLAITVDAPILMIVLFFYLFVVVKRGKSMKTESFLKKVSESSEGFYEKFISLFHSRKTITLAITGLLALHLLVEIGHVIIPYTTGLLYPWYFEQLGPGHVPLAQMMLADFSIAAGIGSQIGVLLIYAINVLAVLMLFFGPAYAWSQAYRKQKIVPNIGWLFFGALAVFLIEPVFKMGLVQSATLLGTDITTQQIPNIGNMWMAMLVGALVAGVFYLLGRKHIVRTQKVAYVAVFAYFGMYIFYFFVSLAGFYIKAVTLMAQAHQYFIAIHILIFFTITIVFYIGGYLMFLYNVLVRQKY